MPGRRPSIGGPSRLLRGSCLLVLSAQLAPGAGGGEPVWIDLDEDESYTARHECSFVQAGDRFYMFGGRENARTLDTYDFASDAWSVSAMAPIEFNHFQATGYEGLVWVVGAFKTNSFPNEAPADDVWVYDPARDRWMQGPTVPVARRRGSTGLVVHDGKFYVVGGNTIGHNGGYVPWFDEYDPGTGAWTPLTDAPGARDHFHAATVGGKLYAVGGRLSGGDGGTFAPLIPEVDVYDFAAAAWSRLPAAADLPTPRAASAVAVFGGEIFVIGGEGNGQAYATVESFDPLPATWQTRASLHHARHGTQAIVSGPGIYVAAGSPNQGGGNQRNMEVYDTYAPAGGPVVAAVLSAPAEVTISADTPSSVPLTHAGGNQGAFVNDVSLSGPDAGDFTILTDVSRPFLVRTGDSREVMVEFHGTTEGALASLDVTWAGGESLPVALTGSLVPAGPGRIADLRVGRNGTDLELSWAADCGGGDLYGVYRGDLAAGYDSLSAEACDVPAGPLTIAPGLPAGEFFLVVPSTGALEGDYGTDGACAPRPSALQPCHPATAVPVCPSPCR